VEEEEEEEERKEVSHEITEEIKKARRKRIRHSARDQTPTTSSSSIAEGPKKDPSRETDKMGRLENRPREHRRDVAPLARTTSSRETNAYAFVSIVLYFSATAKNISITQNRALAQRAPQKERKKRNLGKRAPPTARARANIVRSISNDTRAKMCARRVVAIKKVTSISEHSPS